MSKWLKTECHGCCGNGTVSCYSYGDFEGPGECDTCGGKGYLFVSEKDRLKDYPGGRFVGYSPGLYKEILKIKRDIKEMVKKLKAVQK
jgi:hypothetical protein